MAVARYKVTIEKVTRESYEMVLEAETVMAALDEARHLVANRNRNLRDGKFHVTKIETQEPETNE